MSQLRLERLAPIAGILFAVFIAATRVIVFTYPDADESTEKVLAFWSDKSDKLLAISLLDAFAGLFFVVFAALLRDVLSRGAQASERMATLAFAGAVLVAAGIWVDASLVYTAAESAGDVSPGVTETISAIQADFFFPFLGGFILFFFAAGLASLRTAALPKWAGWSAIVIAVLWLLPNPLVIFLTFAWTVAVSVLFLIREPEMEAQAS